jgi:type IV pilus assembly protein PilB
MPVQLSGESKEKLGAMRKKEEEDLVSILSQKYNLPYANLWDVAINTDGLALLTEKVAREQEVAIFGKNGKNLQLAVRTPNNPNIEKLVAELGARGYHVDIYMASRGSLDLAWSHYKSISFAVETEAGVLDISNEEIHKLMMTLTTLQVTRDAVIEVLKMKKIYRITRTLEIVIAGALANKASDIHVEPGDDAVEIRYRMDGVLTHLAEIDPETYKAVLTRIKLLSGLKINIRNSAQDGRFSVRLDNREIEIRTSLLPGNYGESIVMRLLDPKSIGKSLEDLGMRPQFLEVMHVELEKPNGMILNTGPTGSGKTTTLYAFLKHVFDPGLKILTIEDPIEYHLAGIVQTQVNHKEYTFASGLRSALRQDPDIIMVGEIRDEEVASTAVHAALTGHLVFSTLHTNNAAGAFTRLVDIGVDSNIVGSAVNMVMAQRLVRVLDPARKREVPIEGKDKEFIDRVLSTLHDKSLIPQTTSMWVEDVPEGETGYDGRIGVYEVIRTTRDIEDAVRKSLSIREMEEVARTHQGFMSMHEDAILKVLEGVTTIEEVRRILGEDTNSGA